MFYDVNDFVKFNMFNCHFFKDSSHKQAYLDFMARSEKLTIIIDPPYGGMVKLIANTIEKLKKDFKGQASNLTIMVFYPYFIEPWINKWLPDLKMVDYRVRPDDQAQRL